MRTRIVIAVVSVMLSLAHTAAADPSAWRDEGLAQYEMGHYTAAAAAFRRAADDGDPRSAEILALMYRYGPRLYGDAFPADASEAARWAAVATQRRTAQAALGVIARP